MSHSNPLHFPVTGIEVTTGEIPIIATAIHNGHRLFSDYIADYVISEDDRLREEDPFTEEFTKVTDNRIVNQYSRFAVDLNRPREKAIYTTPKQSWGLQVWKEKPTEQYIKVALDYYDNFYKLMEQYLNSIKLKHSKFVVLDLHSYCYRRNGADAEPEPDEKNPEINVGTSNMDEGVWGDLVRQFMSDLQNYDYKGRSFDVRKNVKFPGGHFSRWIHDTYPESGCSLAIEFKKIFMDEWTGEPYPAVINHLQEALRGTRPGLLRMLRG